MDEYKKNYNLSSSNIFQIDVDNLFRCYMDLMRAFAIGAENSVTNKISLDFVSLYDVYRKKYGESFVNQMLENLVPKLTGALEMAEEDTLDDDPRKKQAVFAVASGTLQILRMFDYIKPNFEELSDAQNLRAKIQKKYNK